MAKKSKIAGDSEPYQQQRVPAQDFISLKKELESVSKKFKKVDENK